MEKEREREREGRRRGEREREERSEKGEIERGRGVGKARVGGVERKREQRTKYTMCKLRTGRGQLRIHSCS